jgi:hypothetical protein
MLPVARTRAINLIADEALTANRAAGPPHRTSALNRRDDALAQIPR